MRRALICGGILGGGTALVFALAAVVAMAFPQGSLVAGGWNGGFGGSGAVRAVNIGPKILQTVTTDFAADDVVTQPLKP
jgi:hypothetical protein